MLHYNNFKNFFDKNTSRFSNLWNFFTFRSFAILAATLVLSFSVRLFLITYFHFDLLTLNCLQFVFFTLSNIRVFLFDMFDIHPLLCEPSDKGKGKVRANSPDCSYTLRPIAYDPNKDLSRSARTSVASSRVTSTYSIPIKYAPSITRDSISYSRPLSGIESRPVSELYSSRRALELSRCGGVLRTPTKDMVSEVLPSRPRHIHSKLPFPTPSGNLPLFEDNSQVVNVPKAPNTSNLTTPNTMSPLFPTSSTNYSKPNISGRTSNISSRVLSPVPHVDSNNNSTSKQLINSSTVKPIVQKGIVADNVVVNRTLSNSTTSTLNTEKEFKIRKRKVVEGVTRELAELNRGYSSKEVVIGKKGFLVK